MRALIRVFLIVIRNSHFFGKVYMSQYETPHNNSDCESKISNSKRVTFSGNKQHSNKVELFWRSLILKKKEYLIIE